MSDGAQREAIRGTWIAAATFLLWGLMPLYWHLLKAVPSMQIVLHRIAWSALFVGAFLFWRDGRGWLRAALAQPRLRGMLALSGVLIATLKSELAPLEDRGVIRVRGSGPEGATVGSAGSSGTARFDCHPPAVFQNGGSAM